MLSRERKKKKMKGMRKGKKKEKKRDEKIEIEDNWAEINTSSIKSKCSTLSI